MTSLVGAPPDTAFDPDCETFPDYRERFWDYAYDHDAELKLLAGARSAPMRVHLVAAHAATVGRAVDLAVAEMSRHSIDAHIGAGSLLADAEQLLGDLTCRSHLTLDEYGAVSAAAGMDRARNRLLAEYQGVRDATASSSPEDYVDVGDFTAEEIRLSVDDLDELIECWQLPPLPYPSFFSRPTVVLPAVTVPVARVPRSRERSDRPSARRSASSAGRVDDDSPSDLTALQARGRSGRSMSVSPWLGAHRELAAGAFPG